MILREIYKRILERLAAVNLTASAASDLAGKPDAIRNMKRAIRDGARGGVSTSTIRALAPVLECSPEYLLHGLSEPPRDDGDQSALNEQQALTVRLVFQAFLGLVMEDRILQEQLKDPGHRAALARVAAQFASSRRVLEAAMGDEDTAIEAVRLALEIQREQ